MAGALASVDETDLFHGAPTPVLRLSRDGKVVSLNRAATRVFGLEADRLVGSPILAAVVPDDRQRIKDFFLRVLQGQQCEWTTRFEHGDGTIRVQRVRAVPSVADGRVESIIMFTTDVAGAREAPSETLQLQALLENLPGQFTAVLDQAGRIRSSSGMARTHFRDDAELVGEHYSTLLEVSDQSSSGLEAMLEAVAAADHWMGTLWYERVDGLTFPARTFASPYVDGSDGRVLGTLVAGADTSVEHQWRGRARRAEGLAAIGQFAASIAGEFEAGLSRLEAEVGVTNGAGSELARLRGFAGSMHQLGAEEGDDRALTSVESVVAEVIEGMRARLSAVGASVTLDVAEGVPKVVADRARLRRVVELLLENALESVAAVDERWVRVAVCAEPNGVVTYVTDSGPALEEDVLHRVFEPFFTTKRGRPGLGLSLVRALVQAHDGRVWTDIDDDERVLFAVQLPTPGAASEGRFRPVPLELSQNRSILVVDDEEDVRISMRRFLEKVGFEVREAWSGRSALAQITGGRRPELVLTDLRMRDGSGFWFLEELKRDFPDLLRRTMILTGDPDHDRVRKLVSATGCPVVGKPVELPELLELLDELGRRD